jgi:hypothetical protein
MTEESPEPKALALMILSNNESMDIKVMRYLTESEAKTHTRFTPICSEIRNLIEVFRIVECAISEWNSYLDLEQSNVQPFYKKFANYRLAVLLAMIYMLDDHVESASKRLEREKLIKKDSFKFWYDHRGHDGFLGLVSRMRNVSQHVSLPIKSYQKTVSAEGVKIRADLHSDSRDDDVTVDLNSFRMRLETFIVNVCMKELIPMFKEILTPAYSFYNSMHPGASNKYSTELVVIGTVSNRKDQGLADVTYVEVPGRFFEDLRIGFGA